jgi:hypothetical protein
MMKSIEFLRVLATLYPHFATNALQCIDEIQEMEMDLAEAQEALWAYADWAGQGHDSNWLPQGHKDAVDAAKRRKEGKAELVKVKMSV